MKEFLYSKKQPKMLGRMAEGEARKGVLFSSITIFFFFCITKRVTETRHFSLFPAFCKDVAHYLKPRYPWDSEGSLCEQTIYIQTYRACACVFVCKYACMYLCV